MSEAPHIKMKAQYSTASAKSVAAFITKKYRLPKPIECSLFHRGFNDSFDVTDADGRRYIMRLSCKRARGDADVVSETAFLHYLNQAGVPVAVVEPTREGTPFSYCLMPEGRRAIVLFHYIEGRAVNWEASADATLQGITLAHLHNSADEYAERDRGVYRLDLDHLLHRPVKAILGIKGLSLEIQSKLIEFSKRLSDSVSEIDNLTWTRCHGDCHGGNARFAEGGQHAGKAVFFDFDDGGPGYLAYDLAVNLWARTFFNRMMHAQWHAFIKGYKTIRPITSTDFEAVHLFAAMRHIWLLGEYAGRRSDVGTQAIPATWVENEIKNLQLWENDKINCGFF